MRQINREVDFIIEVSSTEIEAILDALYCLLMSVQEDHYEPTTDLNALILEVEEIAREI